MLLKDYLKKNFGMDVTMLQHKQEFISKMLKQCSYIYSGTCAEYGIDPNSPQGREYEEASRRQQCCLYLSSLSYDHQFVSEEGNFYATIGISQRLAGRLLLSNTGEGADLNVLLDAEVVEESWEDDGGIHRAMKLKCAAKQQPCTIQFKS